VIGLSRLRGRVTAARVDTERDRRTTQVLQVVEQFVYDLGLLIAGTSVDLERYVDAASAARLRAALGSETSSVLTTRPEFGDYAQVCIEGDLLESDQVIRVVAEFDDRSTRMDARGRTVSRSRRRIRLRLLINPPATRVLDYRVEVA
jgi:hypothetical protein